MDGGGGSDVSGDMETGAARHARERGWSDGEGSRTNGSSFRVELPMLGFELVLLCASH